VSLCQTVWLLQNRTGPARILVRTWQDILLFDYYVALDICMNETLASGSYLPVLCSCVLPCSAIRSL